MNTDAYFHTHFAQRFSKAQVEIDWQANERSYPHELQKGAERFWQTEILATAKRAHVFNGALCRLEGWRIKQDILTLRLGRTTYKELIFCNQHANDILQKFGAEHLSRALGISAVVVSADARLVLIVRSAEVGEGAHAIDVPGGHIHPEEHAQNGVPDPFLAIREELLEELDLSPEPNQPLDCIGLVETAETRKPELIFQFRSHLNAATLIRRGRQKQSREIAHWLTVADDRGEILAFVEKQQARMSQSAIGTLCLYAQMTE